MTILSNRGHKYTQEIEEKESTELIEILRDNAHSENYKAEVRRNLHRRMQSTPLAILRDFYYRSRRRFPEIVVHIMEMVIEEKEEKDRINR